MSFSDGDACLIFGAFGALSFISPVIGGYLADKFLGYVHAIILGALLLSAGYFLLALDQHISFIFALVLLTCGNGFFKPNVSTFLGKFYRNNDSRRETGFTLFYIGINVGGTIGIILCGFAAKFWGWTTAFMFAGTGMLLAIVFFLLGFRCMKQELASKWQQLNIKTMNNKIAVGLVYFGLVLAIIPLLFMLQTPEYAYQVLLVFSVLLISYLLLVIRKCKTQERRKLAVCIILIVFSIAFWSLYQQAPMLLTLYVARDVNLHVLGFKLPASSLWALSGISLILLSPGVLKLWDKLQQRRLEPAIPTKFALGICLIGLAYLVLKASSYTITSDHQASLWWIIASYGFQTLGELFLSPIGLAMITVLAPEKLRGMMMGVWFFTLAAASAIAGQLAKLNAVPKDNHDLLFSATHYGNAFASYGSVALAVGVLMLLLSPMLTRKIGMRI